MKKYKVLLFKYQDRLFFSVYYLVLSCRFLMLALLFLDCEQSLFSWKEPKPRTSSSAGPAPKSPFASHAQTLTCFAFFTRYF